MICTPLAAIPSLFSSPLRFVIWLIELLLTADFLICSHRSSDCILSRFALKLLKFLELKQSQGTVCKQSNLDAFQ